MKIGDKVRTVNVPDVEDTRGWTEAGLSTRRWGIEAEIIGEHSSHGHYFTVRHLDNGSLGYYERVQLIPELTVSTCHRQEIGVGTQVAYAKPISASINTMRMYNNINVSGGTLCVSTVTRIEQVSAAFAEADAMFMLTLANGDKVDLDDVCVTDGKFEYGGKVA